MFLECGVASCSFGSVPLAVRCATLSVSYIPDSELEGKGGWREPGPAGKTLLYVSVNHFNSHFLLVEYTVHHMCSILCSALCYC
jgi:hypothetical protein